MAEIPSGQTEMNGKKVRSTEEILKALGVDSLDIAVLTMLLVRDVKHPDDFQRRVPLLLELREAQRRECVKQITEKESASEIFASIRELESFIDGIKLMQNMYNLPKIID